MIRLVLSQVAVLSRAMAEGVLRGGGRRDVILASNLFGYANLLIILLRTRTLKHKTGAAIVGGAFRNSQVVVELPHLPALLHPASRTGRHSPSYSHKPVSEFQRPDRLSTITQNTIHSLRGLFSDLPVNCDHQPTEHKLIEYVLVAIQIRPWTSRSRNPRVEPRLDER